MKNNKLNKFEIIENVALIIILIFIIAQAYFNKDSYFAVVSAICGITYTFLAGKGKPICYLFGLTGSGFYSFLSFQNAIWGNLFLYACYYIPMQIAGFFKWNKNLKDGKREIIKIKLSKKEFRVLLIIVIILSGISAVILYRFNGSHPILDSLTTVFSVGGMYLTVRRAIEQWLFWMIVNSLSFYMWLKVVLSGVSVYSTVIMWGVYLLLAIYFYLNWKNEIKELS